MEGWRIPSSSMSSSNYNGKSNGKSNGTITTTKSERNFKSWDYSQKLQSNGAQQVKNSEFRNRKINSGKDKVTCSFVVTLHKDGIDQPELTKTFVFETFNLGKLSTEDMERLQFKKMSFDLKVEEPSVLGGRQLYEGIVEDENANACKQLSYSNLHFDWSRFQIPRSLKKIQIPSKSGRLVKSLLSLFVVLFVVGVILSFGGESETFNSFIESICIAYQK